MSQELTRPKQVKKWGELKLGERIGVILVSSAGLLIIFIAAAVAVNAVGNSNKKEPVTVQSTAVTKSAPTGLTHLHKSVPSGTLFR